MPNNANMKAQPDLYLASSSPQRRRLMAEAGYAVQIVPPDEQAEDPIRPGEKPTDYAARMARQKADNVAPRIARGILIACDTVVACRGEVLGKPVDPSDARRMLRLLSGSLHEVHSGLCLRRCPNGPEITGLAVTRLRMVELSQAQIEDYVASQAWRGKAGAFGYQDRVGWLHLEQGSESNVIGLPLELLAEMLPRLAH